MLEKGAGTLQGVWPWRRTAGAEPGAVKIARRVLNGGDEETCGNATRLVPIQLSWQQQGSRMRCPRRNATMFQVLEAVQEVLQTHPLTAIPADDLLILGDQGSGQPSEWFDIPVPVLCRDFCDAPGRLSGCKQPYRVLEA